MSRSRADHKSPPASRLLANAPTLSYLPDADRHVSRGAEPLYRFGIIGCGIMGTEHARNTLLEGRASVAGLYDPAPRSIESAQQALAQSGQTTPAREYRSLAELCDDPQIDALFICTPNHTHLEVLQQVHHCGKAIFLEKPIATSVADAWSVCQLLASATGPVRLGLQYRYKAIYAEVLHEVLERGSVGRVHGVNMLEHRFPFLDKVGQWNKFNRYSGGTLIEKCCHYFDLMTLLAQGRPQRVFATGHQAVNFKDFRYNGEAADGLDQASVIIDYDNQVIGNFELCMFAPGSTEQLIVTGNRGRLRAQEHAAMGADNENLLEIWQGESGVSRRTTPSYPRHIERAGHHGSTFFEHAQFIDDLIVGSNSGPSLEQGFWSVMVGAAAQASIESGAPVLLEDLLPADFEPSIFAAQPQGQHHG